MLEALHHAAATADPARVAALAERAWAQMNSSFQSFAWRRWVGQLSEEVLRVRPVLCTEYAWALMDTGQTEASEAWLRHAERWLSGAHSTESALHDEMASMAAWVEQTRAAGNLAFALASGFYPAEIRLAQGQLREADRLYRQFLNLVPADHEALRMAAPHLHLGLTMIAHEQDNAQTATLHLRTSKEQGDRIMNYLNRVVGATIPVLPYDEAEARWHGRERARLAALGRTPSLEGTRWRPGRGERHGTAK